MSPDVGYSFSNNIIYYPTGLLIKRYKVEVAKEEAIRSAVIVVI